MSVSILLPNIVVWNVVQVSVLIFAYYVVCVVLTKFLYISLGVERQIWPVGTRNSSPNRRMPKNKQTSRRARAMTKRQQPRLLQCTHAQCVGYVLWTINGMQRYSVGIWVSLKAKYQRDGSGSAVLNNFTLQQSWIQIINNESVTQYSTSFDSILQSTLKLIT